jgi:aspartate-semialdehyde dehydrogenase
LREVRVGIVGATGIVGRELLMLLAESTIEVKEMRLSASPGSVGKRVSTHLGEQAIIELNEEFFAGMDLCFFCVSGDVSRRWVPVAAARGVMCIDNSSAFRMLAEVPIVVPEVNGDLLRTGPRIVANPNCCVAQLAVVLAPIHRQFGLEEVHLSTYQSVSGAGQRALEQLERELAEAVRFNSNQFLFNVIPQIGPCTDEGHCQEELKIIEETRKVLNCPCLPMTVTAARVGVFRGHCQAVSFRTCYQTTCEEIRENLREAANIRLVDDELGQEFLQPVMVQHTNQVYVGRIRANTQHLSRSFSLWIAADNLRKGAAHNALSIAEVWVQ